MYLQYETEIENESQHNAEKGKVRYFSDSRLGTRMVQSINDLLLTLLFGDEMRLSLSAHSTWWVGLATSVRAELTSSVEVLSLVRHLKVVERLLAAVFSWESSVDLR